MQINTCPKVFWWNRSYFWFGQNLGGGGQLPLWPLCSTTPAPIDAYFVRHDHHINHQSYLPFIFHIFHSTILHELIINDYDTGVFFIIFPPTVDKSRITNIQFTLFKTFEKKYATNIFFCLNLDFEPEKFWNLDINEKKSWLFPRMF